jgi:hypothetical protein
VATLIGTLTAPGGGDFFAGGECFASSFAAVASGDVDTMTFAATAAAFTSFQMAIYADSAGSPGARLGITNTTSTTGAGNKVLTPTVPIPVVSGTTYWLAILPLGGTVNFNLVSGGSYKGHTGETAFQDPFGSVTSTNASNRFPILGEGTVGSSSAAAILAADYSRFPKPKLRSA